MEQLNNPLHGKTLEAIVVNLVSYYSWEELGNARSRAILSRCFTKVTFKFHHLLIIQYFKSGNYKFHNRECKYFISFVMGNRD